MKKSIILLVISILLITITLININGDLKEKSLLSINVIEKNNSETNFAEKIKSLSNWTETPTIYHHNSYLKNGAHDDSYRFSGSNEDVENYVCFGYDKINENGDCPDEYLYRIIGAFDDDKDGKYQIKLIKNDYVNKDVLGTDGNSTNNGFSSGLNDTYIGSKKYVDSFFWLYPDKELTNDWDNSELNKTNLNKNFINYIQDWKYLIDENNWQIGGLSFTDALNNNAKNIFESEINNNKQNKTVESKIGLMYVSDYMYAAKPKFWEYKSYSDTDEDYELAKESNWLYQGLDEWTISKRADSSSSILYIMNNGKIQSYIGNTGFAVRPTFYLKWNVNYISGDGTKENPYIVSKIITESGNSYAEICNDDSASCKLAKESLKATNTDKTLFYHDGKADYDGMPNANFEAEDLSYRYSGSDYQIASGYKTTYNNVFGDLIKRNCNGQDVDYNNYDIDACSENISKYKLAYKNDTLYDTFGEALNQALKDGRVVGNINNFVCLDGTTNENECSSDADLYRIIGLFPNESGEYEMKLIKYDYTTKEELGDSTAAVGGSYSGNYTARNDFYRGSSKNEIGVYYWNYRTDSGKYNSKWNDSNLNQINLNSFYLSYLTKKVAGLSEHITEHKWETVGISNADSYNAKQVYNKELGNEKIAIGTNNCYDDGSDQARACTEKDLIYEDQIGLMYVSDYGYAAYPEAWNQIVNNSNGYDNYVVRNNNWMFMGLIEWSLSRLLNSNSNIWYLTYLGDFSSSFDWIMFQYKAVRPVFYLSSNTKIASGDGSKINPYRLDLSKQEGE